MTRRFYMDGWSDREVWEQRRHDLDEYLADQAYDRLREIHERCHQELREDCKFCREEKEQNETDNY